MRECEFCNALEHCISDSTNQWEWETSQLKSPDVIPDTTFTSPEEMQLVVSLKSHGR